MTTKRLVVFAADVDEIRSIWFRSVNDITVLRLVRQPWEGAFWSEIRLGFYGNRTLDISFVRDDHAAIAYRAIATFL